MNDVKYVTKFIPQRINEVLIRTTESINENSNRVIGKPKSLVIILTIKLTIIKIVDNIIAIFVE